LKYRIKKVTKGEKPNIVISQYFLQYRVFGMWFYIRDYDNFSWPPRKKKLWWSSLDKAKERLEEFKNDKLIAINYISED